MFVACIMRTWKVLSKGLGRFKGDLTSGRSRDIPDIVD